MLLITVRCHKGINLQTAGFPTLFYSIDVYSDAPWKLLLWAVAPRRSHATLRAVVCRQVLSWALIPGRAQHDHNTSPLQKQLWWWRDFFPPPLGEVEAVRSCWSTVEIPSETLVLLSVHGKQIFIQDKSHSLSPNWIGPPKFMAWLGVHVWWAGRQSRCSCRFLPHAGGPRLSCHVAADFHAGCIQVLICKLKRFLSRCQTFKWGGRHTYNIIYIIMIIESRGIREICIFSVEKMIFYECT